MVVAFVLVDVLAIWLLVLVYGASMAYDTLIKASRSMERQARETPPDHLEPLWTTDLKDR